MSETATLAPATATRDAGVGRHPADQQWRPAPLWPRRRRSTRFRSGRWTMILCSSVLVAVVLYAVVVPLLATVDPRVVDLEGYLQEPSKAHPMGTDLLGRDLFVRCAQGIRVSLMIAALAALVSTVIGVVIGSVSAALGGWTDRVVMRVVDATNALPHLLMGVVIVSLWRGQWWAIIASIGLTHWTQVARIVRSELLSVRTREHVLAAVIGGASRVQVWSTHLLPVIVPQAMIAVVLLLPHAIWHESSLSFLGVGLQPNDPSLGTLLQDARSGILAGGWWLLAFPAALLTATCLAIAGIGSRLSRSAMPKSSIEAQVTR
jgi:ABC-type dipeptide/oligopeptide/nickel transport system permease subunit